MKKQISILVILIALLLYTFINSCSQNTSRDKIIKVEVENCKVSIDLKLSDLIDSCFLVRLETTNECVLGQFISNIFISDKYIIIQDRNGIYKFSIDGRFIRKIISVGRGPQEISGTIRGFYDKRKNLLYFDEVYGRRNSFLYVYNIESEKFLEPIKKCFPETWGSFAIYEDSLIIGSIAPGIWGSTENITLADTIPYAFFFQNFKGTFIYGIPSKRRYITYQKTFWQRGEISTGDKDIYIQYSYDDTLFKFSEKKLWPYIIPVYSKSKSNVPDADIKIGDRQFYYPMYENSSFLVFWELVFESTTPNGRGITYNYKYNYFFINKSSGNYTKIRSFTDDLIGQVQACEGNEINFPTFLPDDKLYLLYNPFELLSNNIVVTNHKLPENIYKQLQKIKSDLLETDNPILLIGSIKKPKDMM